MRTPLAALALLAACTTGPRDPFVDGERSLRCGDLFTALRHFDGVPVTDPRYPEARLTAAALERRLRRQQELLLLGLRLRSEWRDEEAVAAFRDALEAWPGQPQALALLEATKARQRTMEPLRGAGEAPVRELQDPAAPLRPGAPATAAADGARPAAGEDRPLAGGETAGGDKTAGDKTGGDKTAGERARPPLPPVAPQLDDPASPEAAAALQRIEAKLAGSDMEPVLAELVALQRTYPNDQRVANRLARLLQQRGLMRYGQGNVAGALIDWQRALDLDASLRSARTLLDLAAAELAGPAR